MLGRLCPKWRMDQGLQEVFDLNNGGVLQMSELKAYKKWVVADVKKEEGL